MSTSISHVPQVEVSPNKTRTLRTAALIASVALHVALLGMMLLRPIQFSQLRAEPKESQRVLGEIAQSDGSGAKVSAVDKKTADQTASQATKEFGKGPPKPAPQHPLPPTQTRNIAKAPKLKQPPQPIHMPSPESFDVAALVAQMIAVPNTDQPVDFELREGEAFAQMAVGATAALTGVSPLSGGRNCTSAQALQMALQDDVPFKEALRKIPRDDRSVANVIMAWDGQRIGSVDNPAPNVGLGNDTLFPEILKQRIVDHLRSGSIECLNEIVEGPAFILIGDDMEPTILAFGSGVWKWADLVADNQPLTPQKRSQTFLDPVSNFIHP